MLQKRNVSFSRNSGFGQGCEDNDLKKRAQQREKPNSLQYELHKRRERVCDKCRLVESGGRIAVGDGKNH
jgi:hypothetical protein